MGESTKQVLAIQQEGIEEAKKRESKIGKRFIIILSLALLFVAFITSAFVYIQNTPEKVIDDMMAQMTTLKSAHYKIKMQGQFADSKDEEMSKSSFDKMQNLLGLMSVVMMDGGLSIGDMTQPAVMSNIFELEGDMDAQDSNNQKFQFALSLDDFGASVEAKSIGKELYVKLSELSKERDAEEISFIDFFNLGMFADQWVKISLEEIEETFGAQGLSEEVEKQQQAAELTEDQIEQVENLAKEIKRFEIKEVLGKEIVDGDQVYHYQISLLKEGIKEYMARLNEITHQFEEKQLQYFQDGFEDIGETTLDLWISKGDRWLYKAVGQVEANGEKAKIEFELTKHNQSIEISAPKDYKALEEIVEKIQKSEAGNEFQIDTDQDGLTDFDESIWGTNINNSDTDGDGYGDSEEIKNGYDPLGPGILFEIE